MRTSKVLLQSVRTNVPACSLAGNASPAYPQRKTESFGALGGSPTACQATRSPLRSPTLDRFPGLLNLSCRGSITWFAAATRRRRMPLRGSKATSCGMHLLLRTRLRALNANNPGRTP